MIKKVFFQLHWFLGITAGLVLALMGTTGALQSFQPEILRLLNPGVLTIAAPAGATPLAPDVLRERVQADMPGRRLNSLTLLSDPRLPARAVFALPPPSAGQPMRRGELRWVDPFTGKVLPVPRGVGFFETVRELHRFLLAGEIGKQIVGACAMILIFLSLSGLYLRWPRQVAQWKAWLSVSPRQKGRAFLWNLHATLGTLALLCYLLSALTGMYWAVDVYRSTVSSMLGAPQRGAGGLGGGGPNAAQNAASGAGPTQTPGRGPAATAAAAPTPLPANTPPLSLDRARAQIIQAAGAIDTITFALPARPDQPLQVTYIDAGAPHDRATNQVVFDAAGSIRQHQRYADKPAGVRLVGSVYPLHTGEFFGLPGRIILMLSALGLPVFAVTGWMLYLDRRRKTRALRDARGVAATASTSPDTSATPLLIAFASQSGTAERLAWQTAHALQGAGVQVAVHSMAGLDLAMLSGFRRALFVVSTFGDGEAPDAARRFARQVMSQTPSLHGIGFGMLSLGDRCYAGFCGFGRSLQDWLVAHGAHTLFDTVEVDNHHPAALAAWQQQLGTLGAVQTAPWQEQAFEPWTLTAREQVNPGSQGSPLFHLVLTPASGVVAHWQSGDLVEVMPRHRDEDVTRWLRSHGLDPNAPGDAGRTLAESVADSEWITALPADADRDALLARLQPMRPRQYSIASIPTDGAVHLLVRRSEHEAGLGLASGLLTATAPISGTVSLRLRTHPGFHLSADNLAFDNRERPLILVGNGSGMAGLMGHLNTRIAAGQRRNWLVYGDRNAAVDLPYREQLTAWQESGDIERMDLAFSRDQPERIYVQHKLADASTTLREWVERGAAIYVCGSLEGMAGGVDAVLHAVLGSELVDALTAAGRYRRDVY
jgi:sulfite reductase (NADPH) flavoprotein alpha-component